MPTTYTREQTKRSSGGLFSKFYFVKKASDGTFSVPGTGTDPMGNAYGTIYEAGSSLKTDWPRSADGVWGIKYQIVEATTKWLNLINKLAPPKATAGTTEKIELEDENVLQGADSTGGTGDDTLPYVVVAHQRKVVSDSTEKPALVFLGQFSRSGGGSSEPNVTAKPSFEANAVDGNGYTPDFTGDAVLGTVAFTAFSGDDRMGYWIDAAA
jgi:hypothetical protein